MIKTSGVDKTFDATNLRIAPSSTSEGVTLWRKSRSMTTGPTDACFSAMWSSSLFLIASRYALKNASACSAGT